MLYIIQIIAALALITVIILQAKGTGIGNAFGVNSLYHSKRGIEKSLFTLTIILAIIFLAVCLTNAL